MKDLQHSAVPLGALGAFLLCLPCLLPVLAVFVGAGAFWAFGGWVADNAIVAALGSAVALAAASLAAYAIWLRRQRGAVRVPAHEQALAHSSASTRKGY